MSSDGLVSINSGGVMSIVDLLSTCLILNEASSLSDKSLIDELSVGAE